MDNVRVDQALCKKCGLCSTFCPQKVFNQKGEVQDEDKCNGCTLCQYHCPERAIILKDSVIGVNAADNSNSQRQGGWEERTPLLAPGKYLLSGNEACAQAALDVGCKFFAGYPITPASEVMYKMRELQNDPNGAFIQMEDEISCMAAVIGASWAGKKSMTGTSGPGFSLMQENLSYAVMTETPCVIVVVQRAGPSTGQATRPAAADVMQAIWGSHGDSQKIVLVPSSPAECYEYTIEAFNLSEIFRTPVILLVDQIIAHLEERIEIPDRIKAYSRFYIPGDPPFGSHQSKSVSSMPKFGDGEELSITGSTHYPSGIRAASDPDAHQQVVNHLSSKIEAAEKNSKVEGNASAVDDIIFVTYGSVANSVKHAIAEIRRTNKDIKVGYINIGTIWPFPYEHFRFARRNYIKANTKVVVLEMNQGQVVHLVREILPDAISLTQNNGLPIEPKRIRDYILKGEW